MQVFKTIGALTDEEQREKLKAFTKLLKENGLGHIKPKVFEQVVCPLKQNEALRQIALMTEGNVKKDLKPVADKVVKEAKETIFEGIAP